MDASAIMQDDTSIENMRALTEFTRDTACIPPAPTRPQPLSHRPQPPRQPIPPLLLVWQVVHSPILVRDVHSLGRKSQRTTPLTGDPEIVKRIWENTDAFGNMYIWQVLLSF